MRAPKYGLSILRRLYSFLTATLEFVRICLFPLPAVAVYEVTHDVRLA